MKYMLAVLGVIVFILGATWLFQGNDFFLYKTFAPKYENVRRDVFVNTNSYVQGKTEYISRLRMQYETADDGHKAALRELIISEASNVDNSKLPPDLQAFINNLKGAL